VLLALIRRSAGQSWLVLAGCAVVVCGFEVVLVAQAVSIEWTSAFQRMEEFIPAFLQRGLGQQAMLLATFKGTIAFGYFHPVVMILTAIVAAYFATEPAHDVESGRVDLTLARAVPRHRLITRSLSLMSGSVVLFLIVMAAGTTAGLYAFAPATWEWPDPVMVGRLIAHLAAVAWCCGAFALAVAAGSKRWTTAFSLAALTIVVMYLLDFVAIAWPRARAVAWLSPFDYYPAIPILGGTAPAWSNLIVLWIATIVFTAIAYWRFERRDL
jgi:ABC-type transport system involved in multi-copper enzyme maturation permease subunit